MNTWNATVPIRQRYSKLAVLSAAVFCLTVLPARAQTMFLDGSLTDAEAAAQPNTFNTFQKAAAHFGDSVTLYIRPWVYWIDNPDVPDVVEGRDGREPFGMVIHAKKLHFIGMGNDAGDIVLASARGQTQGAVGNFTMFDFHVDTLVVENLTMGNYCNVDLDYRLQPKLSRKKRSDAITQAHVGYVHGDRLYARNVRFISRLNLNPLNGARHSTYEDCHFECTDDALNGNAVYRHCTIDLYGQKPFWSTYGRGALFIDCDFHVMGHNREMYFMKQGGPLTLVNCRYYASDSTYIGWTPYPQGWLRCYQQQFTLNGKPYTIGSRHDGNTVMLHHLADSISVPPYVNISRHQATLQTGRDTLRLYADAPHWRIPAGKEQYVDCRSIEGGMMVLPTNNTDETAVFCIEAYTDDGQVGACELMVKPSILPPPDFISKPTITLAEGVATLNYSLALNGRPDESSVTWFVIDGGQSICVAVSHDHPARTYKLSPADVGKTLMAVVCPKSSRSLYGDTVSVCLDKVIAIGDIKTTTVLDTDFSTFPCRWQPDVVEGRWTVDGFKPTDTAEYPWTFDRAKPMWTYGKGFNGAVGSGLLQAQRGARLMYTPVAADYGDMELTLCVDPTKTAGQGFGSATGQYMDVCLKFDTQTLTGYGLRIVRTPKSARAVDFLLVSYDHGTISPLTNPITATCYRTGCTISVSATGSRLTAHVETTTPQPEGSSLPHVVDLSAPIKPLVFGGIAIQHTGSCGESTTMLHRLQVKW